MLIGSAFYVFLCSENFYILPKCFYVLLAPAIAALESRHNNSSFVRFAKKIDNPFAACVVCVCCVHVYTLHGTAVMPAGHSTPPAVDNKTRPLQAGLSAFNCENELAFLALFFELLSAFFGVDENVVRVAEMLLPFLASFSVAAPIVKFDLMQVFEKFLIKFGLQLKGE